MNINLARTNIICPHAHLTKYGFKQGSSTSQITFPLHRKPRSSSFIQINDQANHDEHPIIYIYIQTYFMLTGM